jgi:hypothetical protein
MASTSQIRISVRNGQNLRHVEEVIAEGVCERRQEVSPDRRRLAVVHAINLIKGPT